MKSKGQRHTTSWLLQLLRARARVWVEGAPGDRAGDRVTVRSGDVLLAARVVRLGTDGGRGVVVLVERTPPLPPEEEEER